MDFGRPPSRPGMLSEAAGMIMQNGRYVDPFPPSPSRGSARRSPARPSGADHFPASPSRGYAHSNTGSDLGDSSEDSSSEDSSVERARHLYSLNRKISDEFAASSPGGSRFASDFAPSRMAQRENYKKEQHTLHIERGAAKLRVGLAASQKGGNSASEANAAAADRELAMREQAFKKELADISSLMTNIGASLGGEGGTMNPAEERQRAAKEAEAKRRAEEARAAWKAEQEARDPHRKIRLRIENRRNFEDLEGGGEDKNAVPMMIQDFAGGEGGVERVPLVDVRLIQSRCILLNESSNVKGMLELQRCKEKTQRISGMRVSSSCPALPAVSGASDAGESPARKAKPWNTCSRGGSPVVMRRSPKLTGCGRANFETSGDMQLRRRLKDKLQEQREHSSPSIGYGRSWEARSDNANRRRQAVVVETLLTKLDGMRGQLLPHMLPPGLEAFADVAAQAAGHGKGKGARGSVLMAGAPDERAGSPGARARTSIAGGSGDSEGKRKDGKNRHRTSSEAEPKVTAESLAIRKRAQHRLRIFKGVMWTFMAFLSHRRKTRNVESIKLFLQQIGEWARIRSAVKRVVGNIRLLQRSCRECVASKRKRCDELSKMWERVEDRHLSAHFKMYAKKILQESKAASQDLQMTGAPKKNRSKQSVMKEALMKEALEQAGVDAASFAESSLDWKALRIPREERRKSISNHYMASLKHHVREQKQVIETIQNAVQHQKDLNILLKKFGADDQAEMKGVLSQENGGKDLPKAVESKFWDMNEEMVLHLIYTAAGALRAQKPFHLHPANMGLAQGAEARRASKAARGRSKNFARSSPAATRSRSLPAAPAAGPARQTRRSANESVPAENIRIKPKESRLDVEEVLKTFTPRLKEMQETAASAPVEGSDNGTAGHGKGVYLPTPDAKNFELGHLGF